MKTVVAPLDVMTEELWIEKLSFAKVSSMTYTSNVLNETLRIDPPFQVSSPCFFKEPTTIGGYNMLSEHFV
jgi:cytochrome P450